MSYSNINYREIKLVQGLYQATGTYNDVHHHAFQCVVNPTTESKLVDLLERRREVPITAFNDAAIGPIVMPSMSSEGVVNIANGWSTRRLRFTLIVDVTTNMGQQGRHIYTGYTNHYQPTFTGNALDPRMTISLNDVVEQRYDATTASWITVRTGAIVHDPSYTSGNIGNTAVTMRPVDVMDQLDISSTLQYRNPNDDSRIVDMRNCLTGRPMGMDRAQQNPYVYSHSLIKAFSDEYRGSQEVIENNADFYSRVGHQLREPDSLARDPLLTLISEHRHRHGSMGLSHMPSTFTVDELVKAFSNLGQDIRHVLREVTLAADLQHVTGQTEDWSTKTVERLIALAIAQGLPPIMQRWGVALFNCEYTNRTAMGELSELPINIRGNGVTGPNAQYVVDMLMLQVRNLLIGPNFRLYDPSMKYIFDLKVSSMLAGETTIEIRLENNPLTRFCYPTFADSLNSPLYTHNQPGFEQLVNDLGRVFEVTIAQHGTATSEQNYGGASMFTTNPTAVPDPTQQIFV